MSLVLWLRNGVKAPLRLLTRLTGLLERESSLQISMARLSRIWRILEQLIMRIEWEMIVSLHTEGVSRNSPSATIMEAFTSTLASLIVRSILQLLRLEDMRGKVLVLSGTALWAVVSSAQMAKLNLKTSLISQLRMLACIWIRSGKLGNLSDIHFLRRGISCDDHRNDPDCRA